MYQNTNFGFAKTGSTLKFTEYISYDNGLCHMYVLCVCVCGVLCRVVMLCMHARFFVLVLHHNSNTIDG